MGSSATRVLAFTFTLHHHTFTRTHSDLPHLTNSTQLNSHYLTSPHPPISPPVTSPSLPITKTRKLVFSLPCVRPDHPYLLTIHPPYTIHHSLHHHILPTFTNHHSAPQSPFFDPITDLKSPRRADQVRVIANCTRLHPHYP